MHNTNPQYNTDAHALWTRVGLEKHDNLYREVMDAHRESPYINHVMPSALKASKATIVGIHVMYQEGANRRHIMETEYLAKRWLRNPSNQKTYRTTNLTKHCHTNRTNTTGK